MEANALRRLAELHAELARVYADLAERSPAGHGRAWGCPGSLRRAAYGDHEQHHECQKGHPVQRPENLAIGCPLLSWLDIYLAAPTPAAPRGTITGYGRFRKDDDEDVIWCGLDSPDLPELRHKVLLRS
jgi:hypothetical protein